MESIVVCDCQMDFKFIASYLVKRNKKAIWMKDISNQKVGGDVYIFEGKYTLIDISMLFSLYGSDNVHVIHESLYKGEVIYEYCHGCVYYKLTRQQMDYYIYRGIYVKNNGLYMMKNLKEIDMISKKRGHVYIHENTHVYLAINDDFEMYHHLLKHYGILKVYHNRLISYRKIELDDYMYHRLRCLKLLEEYYHFKEQ